LPKAASLAAELKQEFGIDPKMIAGRGGIFDVHVDGKLVYSKSSTGRFPESGEVSKLVRGMNGQPQNS
jgi:selenoprotein W-related protein